MRRRNYFPSIFGRGKTFQVRRTTNAAGRKNSTTIQAAASDKPATADKAASCSIARGTERRNYCKGSKTAVRRARNSRVENARADTQKIQSRAQRMFRGRG